jgi:hypothetical protein
MNVVCADALSVHGVSPELADAPFEHGAEFLVDMLTVKTYASKPVRSDIFRR